MSVITVGHKLAEIQRDIDGVKRAYAQDELPGSLSTSDLPAFLNFPGPAEYTEISHGYVQEIRTWNMQLFVIPIGRNPDHAHIGRTLQPFFRATYSRFLESLQLDGLTDVVIANVMDDTGQSVMEWGGIEYAGTSFTIEITEKWTTTDYES